MRRKPPAVASSVAVLPAAAVVAAWVVWAVLPSTWWIVLLAAIPVLVNLARVRAVVAPLMSICLIAFSVTAVVALWATYDQDATRLVFAHPVGWQKLWGLMLAVLFYYALVTIPSTGGHRWAVGMLTALGALVAAGFAATNDWMAQPALWEPITRFGQAIQALLPTLPRGGLNPNVAGGIVAPLLPLAVGLALEGRRTRQTLWAAWGLLAAAAMALALVLSTSRGAWLGSAGALALAAAWWLVGKLFRSDRRLIAFAAILVMTIIAVGLAWASFLPLRRFILDSEPIADRLAIFSQAAVLVRDYAFTGSGLGTFPLVHSTYALLIHVPEISHAHALPLNVGVDQGLIGAASLISAWALAAGLGLRALARSGGPRPLLAAALVSLGVLAIHAVADDAVYSSRGVLFLWVPAALIAVAAQGADQQPRAPRDRVAPARASDRPRDAWFRRIGLTVAVLTTAAWLMLVWRPLAAAFYANLGAVHQTLVELQVYDYKRFSDPTLDQVRQRVDLSEAIGHFQRALALDPRQVTARTRLAQIAFDRSEYDVALEHAEAAWDAGYRDRVTRLVLGDALVAAGQVERAAQVVRGLERAEERLVGQAGSRYQPREDWQRAAYAWRTALALDPGNEQLRNRAARAEEKAAEP